MHDRVFRLPNNRCNETLADVGSSQDKAMPQARDGLLIGVPHPGIPVDTS